MIEKANNTTIWIIPIPYSFFKLGEFLLDFVNKFRNQYVEATRRVTILKKNWIFLTSLANDEIDWSPRHEDPFELVLLLSDNNDKYRDDRPFSGVIREMGSIIG